MARAARAASQVAMGSIDDVRLAVQFATGVSILSREEKTALLKVKGYRILTFNDACLMTSSLSSSVFLATANEYVDVVNIFINACYR